jgi:hypothetical protein
VHNFVLGDSGVVTVDIRDKKGARWLHPLFKHAYYSTKPLQAMAIPQLFVSRHEDSCTRDADLCHLVRAAVGIDMGSDQFLGASTSLTPACDTTLN